MSRRGIVNLKYAKMMALAERITGVHLPDKLLQRRIVASRGDVRYDPDEGYGIWEWRSLRGA